MSEVGEKTTQVNATRFYCGAKRNTWANQRRKRREAARGKLETSKPAIEAGNDVSNNDVSHCGNQDLKNELARESSLQKRPETTGQKSTNLVISNLVSSAPVTPSTIDNDPLSQDFLFQKEDDLGTNFPVTMVKKSSFEVTSSDGNKKRRHDSSEEIDEEYFLEFSVDVGVKLSKVIPGVLSNIFLRMNFISGQDRNSLYQLFQYFQNRLAR